MAFIDDIFRRGNIVTALAFGIGAAILAPVIVPLFSGLVRPLIKATIKGGLKLYQTGRETIAEVGEGVEDLFAEAKAELKQEAERAKPVAQALKQGLADMEKR